MAGVNKYVDAKAGNPLLELLPFLPLHAQGKRDTALFHQTTRDLLDQVSRFGFDQVSLCGFDEIVVLGLTR